MFAVLTIGVCFYFSDFYKKTNQSERKPYNYFYLDTNFKLVNKESFENAYEYNIDGYALAASYEDNNFHFIDGKCNFVDDMPVIETDEQWTRRIRIHYLDDYMYVSTMSKLYIFKNYKLIRVMDSCYVYDVSDNLVTVCNFENLHESFNLFNGSYGCMDPEGNMLIRVKYQYMGAFSSNGLAPVKFDDGSFGYINISEEVVIKLDSNVEFAGDFDADGKYAIVDVRVGDNTKKGMIDQSGNYVLEPKYEYISAFTDDQYAVSEDGEKCGVISLDGAYIISPSFKMILPLEYGLAVAENTDGLWGYIDSNGKTVIDFQYDSANSFTADGFATVFDGDNYGFIDRQGNWKIKPQFPYAGNFENGRAVVLLYEGQKIDRKVK